MTSSGRGHELLPHTADAGFRARAATLPELFTESAAALAELAAEVGSDVEPSAVEAVALEAADLDALVYAWLNELIGLAAVERAALVNVEVERIDRLTGEETGWSMAATVGLAAIDGCAVRPLRDIKSATYHRLLVERDGVGWRLEAYVDI
jgi:SHS2 domain-containing protein